MSATAMAARKIGKQAVVIGAGMAGLAAAGAVADFFERVTVLERDRLPNEAVPRRGTPQSRHLHALLPGGERALTDLFPHFERDLLDAGSVPLRVLSELRVEIPGVGPLPPRDFGWFFYCASRPLIELVTRRQAERLPNLTVRSGAGCARSPRRPMAPWSQASGVNPPMDGRKSSPPISLSTRPDAVRQPWRCSVRPAGRRRMKWSLVWTSIIRRPPS